MATKNNTNEEEQSIKKEKVEIVNEFTDEIELTANFFCVQDLKDYPLYIYVNGVYEPSGAEWIKKYLQNKYSHTNTGIIQEVVNRIKNKNLRPLNLLDSKKDKLVLLNGVYNFKTMSFEEHSPDNYAVIQLPINYDINAKCPKIDKYFREIVPLKYVETIEELFGYLLWRGNDFKMLFMLQGGNDSSKTTIMALMRKFIGMKYITGMEMQKLAKDKFLVAELYGKVANICGDIKKEAINETAMLKILIGNEDLVPAEKKFGGIFSFINFSKLIFGCNIIPHIPENELEFFAGKLFIIQFPNKFAKTKGYLETIATPDELSGLLNLAIKGLQRAFDNGEFTNTLTKEEVIEQYYAISDPTTQFAHDMFECNAASYVEKDNLFSELFQKYLTSKHISYCGTEDKFWKDLIDTLTKKYSEMDYNRKVTINGVQKRVIYGISLKIEQKNENDKPKTPTTKKPNTEELKDKNIVGVVGAKPNIRTGIINNSNIISIIKLDLTPTTQPNPVTELEIENSEPIWMQEGFESEEEYIHYQKLISEKIEEEESIYELWQNNFDHVDIQEQTEPEKEEEYD